MEWKIRWFYGYDGIKNLPIPTIVGYQLAPNTLCVCVCVSFNYREKKMRFVTRARSAATTTTTLYRYLCEKNTVVCRYSLIRQQILCRAFCSLPQQHLGTVFVRAHIHTLHVKSKIDVLLLIAGRPYSLSTIRFHFCQ